MFEPELGMIARFKRKNASHPIEWVMQQEQFIDLAKEGIWGDFDCYFRQDLAQDHGLFHEILLNQAFYQHYQQRMIQFGYRNVIKNCFELNWLNLKIKNKKKGALIIGGGPSLKKELGEIQKRSSDYYIFSCLKSVAILKKEGIEPDFIGVVDPNEDLPLKESLAQSIPCFFSLPARYEQIKQFDYPVLIPIQQADPLTQFFQQFFDLKQSFVETGLTVASFLFSVAVDFFQLNPVVLCGVDLQYQENQRYADLHYDQEKISEKIESGETKVDFYLTKKWFESRSLKKENRNWINCSHGLKIEGFKTDWPDLKREQGSGQKEYQLIKNQGLSRKRTIFLDRFRSLEQFHYPEDKQLSDILFSSDLHDAGVLQLFQNLYAYIPQSVDKIEFFREMLKKFQQEFR